MEKILVMNPGSTSTKIAVFDGETPIFTESIVHTQEELAPFATIMDQLDFRFNCIMDCLKRHEIEVSELNAVVSRGGLLGSIHTGAYQVNEDMIWQLKYKPRNEHASNVGAIIADKIAKPLGIPAYIYDGISVDEMPEIYRVTGLPESRRKGHGHTLNTRAAAVRYASERGLSYNDITVIVAHLGGGVTVNLHHEGKIIDSVNDEEGPLSPERAGGLPMFDVIDMCYSGEYTKKELMTRVKGKGGLIAYFGTSDCREVEAMMNNGDEKAKLVYDAMNLNIAKYIAKIAPDVKGKVDAIILTGGVAYSQYVTDAIAEAVEFIAPVVIYPGEDEMKSLALGCLRVLRGEETASVYVKTDNPKA